MCCAVLFCVPYAMPGYDVGEYLFFNCIKNVSVCEIHVISSFVLVFFLHLYLRSDHIVCMTRFQRCFKCNARKKKQSGKMRSLEFNSLAMNVCRVEWKCCHCFHELTICDINLDAYLVRSLHQCKVQRNFGLYSLKQLILT